MNLALVGYRGTGKTEVSRLAATRLGRRLAGMDAMLVERFRKPIPEFVSEHGWEAFRDAESDLASELSRLDGLVIDCGGGVVVRERNIEILRSNGRIVWLAASVETIAKRIGGDTQRPSLTGAKTFIEEIEEVLDQRLPLYTRAADFRVETDTLSVEQVVQRVLDWWEATTQSRPGA